MIKKKEKKFNQLNISIEEFKLLET